MLKVAVIGIGEQGWDNILPTLAQIPTISTVATCDIDKNKADLASIKYGAKPYYNYNIMFDHEELDAVIVASYPDIHYDVAKIALSRGIPTFVEKPPSFTYKQLLELVSLNTKDVTTGVGLNFNYTETINIVDQLTKKDEFGEIKYISISHYANKPKEPIWGLNSLAKSFLLAQAIHPIGLILRYGDTLSSFDVRTYKNVNDIFINASFNLINSSGSDIIAHLSTGNTSPYFMWRIELITNKSVVVRINSLWEIEIFESGKQTHLIDTPKRWKDVWNPSPLSSGYSRTGYYNQFSEFFDCIMNRQEFSSSLKSLLPVFEILNILEEKLEYA